MIHTYIEFLKEEQKYFGKSYSTECECEICHDKFTFTKRDSRWRNIRANHSIRCAKCSKHIAAVNAHKSGVENLNKARHEKSIAYQKTKKEKENADMTIIANTYDELKSLLDDGRIAASYKCEHCGEIFSLKSKRLLKNFLKRNQDNRHLICKNCKITSTKIKGNKDRVLSRLLDCKLADDQIYTGTHCNSHREDRYKYEFVCNKCGKHFEESLNVGLEVPVACPNCYPLKDQVSTGKKELAKFIKSIYNGKVLENTKHIISPHELDVYLPDKNLAFEFDGAYWHNNSKKTYMKYKLCKEKNIRLIMIYDYEWNRQNNKLKKYIKAQLGIYDTKIGARKCMIKEISYKDANNFINDNHLQGSNPYITNKKTICLGLYCNDELVQIETYNKPRYNSKYDWELIRECSKLGYNIIGGKNKLLTYFRSKFSGSIISYCDNRFFNGNSYIACGFTKLKDSIPNYKYYKYGVILSREQCMKHKLNKLLDSYNPELSETDNMLNNNYFKLYDFGNSVFALK